MLTAPQRRERARQAAYALHSQGGTNVGPAREAWLRRFEDQVDPDRVLPPVEREKRAEQAMKAHMAGLRARRRPSRKAGREAVAAAEAAE